MNLHTVIFIGRSGCGKGTQADLLKERIHERDVSKKHILYVETGEKFRQFIRGYSFSSKLSKTIYESDALQPAFLATLMWGGILLEELEENMHLFVDGAPRSLPEAKTLDTAMKFYKRERPTVVHINVGRKWSEARLLTRGRMDDANLSKIDKRLDWFDEQVIPALDYYRTNPDYRFIEIDGEQTIEQVFSDLVLEYDKNDQIKN